MTKVFRSSFREIFLWGLVVILVFAAGYYRGLKRLDIPFQLSKEPVRILTYDPSLFSLDLLDYLEFELQRPVEVTSVTSWGEFVSKLTSSNQFALGVFPLSWAKKAKMQDLLFQRGATETQKLLSNVHLEFQNSTQNYPYFPWLWAQVFKVSLKTSHPTFNYQLSEFSDLNCNIYPKNIRSQLKFKQENMSLNFDGGDFNSKLVTHRVAIDTNQWTAAPETYLLEVVLFEPKITDVAKDVRFKLLSTLMTENTFDFLRSHKPFATCLNTSKRSPTETADYISTIELKKLKNIEFCETF